MPSGKLMVPIKPMSKYFPKNSAFTLLEVLLAAIIFVITISGVFETLSVMRTPVVNQESSLEATVFGKQVLEALRSKVDASSNAYFYQCSNAGANPCPDFGLSIGQHSVNEATLLNQGGLSWPTDNNNALKNANMVNGVAILNYTVTCADNSNPCNDSARQVTLNINW